MRVFMPNVTGRNTITRDITMSSIGNLLYLNKLKQSAFVRTRIPYDGRPE